MTLEQLREAIIKGDEDKAETLTQNLIDDDVQPETILNEAMTSAMAEVGNQFENNEIFIPEMLIASRAMKAGMKHLEPLLVEENSEPIGTVVIGTVEGDVHDIGKNLVTMMLEGNGFTVVDIGTEVPPEEFISALREENPDILGMSALLTTTRPVMKEVIDLMNDEGFDDVHVMVGGSCVTQNYANEIGADGYGRTASESAERAKELVGA